MSRLRVSHSKSCDAGKDLVGCLGPDKGFGILVVGRQVEPDGVLQGAGTAMRSAANLFVSEGPEPALDLVYPG